MKRIVQISDLHIGQPEQFPHGVDARQSLLDSLDLIDKVLPIDFLVITGDLAHKTNAFDHSICAWLEMYFSSYEAEILVVPGNHDNKEFLVSHFSHGHELLNGELFYTEDLAGRMGIFLDTSSHSISDEQLEWLRDKFSSCIKDHIQPVIFMHHPPCPSGSLFMDKRYPFQRPDDFADALSGYPDYIPIFCGHYHVEKTVLWRNAMIHITPSTCFEIDPFYEKFTLDPIPPGIRVIDCTRESIHSSVLRA